MIVDAELRVHETVALSTYINRFSPGNISDFNRRIQVLTVGSLKVNSYVAGVWRHYMPVVKFLVCVEIPDALKMKLALCHAGF